MPTTFDDNQVPMQAVLLETAQPVTAPVAGLERPQRRLALAELLAWDRIICRIRSAIDTGSEGARGVSVDTAATRVPSFWRTRRGLTALVWLLISFASSAAMLAIYARSLFILVRHGSEPCDVPLAKLLWYCVGLVPMYLARTWLWHGLLRICGRHRPIEGDETAGCQILVLGFACFCLAYYSAAHGIESLQSSETCSRTAPLLYRWARYVFPSGIAQFISLHAVASCSLNAAVRSIFPSRAGACKGLDPGIISMLPSVEPDVGCQCSICLDGFSEARSAKAMPCCGNCFHVDCLQGWMEAHRTCPLCRADLWESVTTANGERSLLEMTPSIQSARLEPSRLVPRV